MNRRTDTPYLAAEPDLVEKPGPADNGLLPASLDPLVQALHHASARERLRRAAAADHGCEKDGLAKDGLANDGLVIPGPATEKTAKNRL